MSSSTRSDRARKPSAKKAPALSSSPHAHPRLRRPPPADPPGSGRPTPPIDIVVTFNEETVADAGIAALVGCPEVFTHAGKLVHLAPQSIPGTALGRSPRSLCIETLPLPRLRELLSRSARWLVPRSEAPGDHVVSQVPQRIVAGIAARREWPGIRPLAGLLVTPVLRPDGTVLQSPGYDDATGLYLAPNAEYPPIAAEPTHADALAAVRVLLEAVIDVPLATPGDQGAWLATVASMFARFAVGSASPLCVVEDTRGARWADELVDRLSAIVGNEQVASINAEDFLAAPRRQLDTLLAQGETLALLTNVSAQTPTGWRRLRESLYRTHATHGVVWCTAIVRARRDPAIAHLGLSIRCEGADSRLREDPTDRPTGTLHEGPSPRLVVAALTMLRAYQVAGSPDVGLARGPGFERWSRFVRSAVVWCGWPDPLAAATASPDSTPATDAASADLLAGWAELVADFPGGCSARQALDALSQAPSTRYPRLRAALAVFAPGPLDSRGTADRLGRCLTRMRDAEHEGHALVFVTSGNQGNRWTVRATEAAAAGVGPSTFDS